MKAHIHLVLWPMYVHMNMHSSVQVPALHKGKDGNKCILYDQVRLGSSLCWSTGNQI